MVINITPADLLEIYLAIYIIVVAAGFSVFHFLYNRRDRSVTRELVRSNYDLIKENTKLAKVFGDYILDKKRAEQDERVKGFKAENKTTVKKL